MRDDRDSRIPWIAGFAAVVLLAGAVFLPSVNSTAIWEDRELMTGMAIGNANTPLQCFTRPFIYHYYRPLTSLSLLIDRRLHPNNPTGFHVTNVLLHMAGTAFVLAFISAAFKSRLAGLLGGALFAVQPAQFLTTAWIGGRTDTLCILFVAIWGWSLVNAVRTEGRLRGIWLAVSASGYLLAAMAKEQALMLLLVVPLAFYCFRDEPLASDVNPEPIANRGEGWLATIPFAAAAVFFTFVWFHNVPPDRQVMPEDWGYQFGVAGRTGTFYAEVLTIPSPKLLYTITLRDFLASFYSVVGFTLMGLTVGAFFVALKRSPRAAWFIAMGTLTLLPVLNFIPMVSLLVGPFRAAITGVAICGLFGGLAAGAIDRLAADEPQRGRILGLLAAAYAIVCGVLTVREAQAYRGDVAVNQTFVRVNPTSVFTHLELAAALIDEKRIAEARHELDLVAFNFNVPKFGQSRETHPINMGDYDSFLAELLVRCAYPLYTSGDKSSARDALSMAYGVAPNTIFVNLGLADISYSEGDWNSSQEWLRRALQINPSLTNRRLARAQMLTRLGRARDAKAEFEECLRRQPDLQAAREGLILVNYALEHPQLVPKGSGKRSK